MRVLWVSTVWVSLSVIVVGRQAVEEDCRNLQTLTNYESSVITSVFVPASDDVPDYCLASGQIPPEVKFRVYLPTTWNERFYMMGNGGYAGHFPRAPGYLAKRLQQGFAVAVTDTGHDSAREPLTSFAVNRQKLLDFAFRAVQVTANTAKKVIRAYYGRPHQKAYFEGCSTGGRQGLILAQRFPADFDGIVVGAPILNETGQRISQAWMAQAMEETPVPRGKLQLLAETIYARCDTEDGLKDGLIADPRSCSFRVSRDLPRCVGDTDDMNCFTKQQLETLEKLYGDVVSQGQRIYPGLPVGAEIATPSGRSGWDDWVVSERGPATAIRFAQSFFRYMAFPERDLDFQLGDFDFDQDPARMSWIKNVLNATDDDLSQFKARGGKIVMFFGWADTAVNPLSGVEYYERVLERMGDSTRDFFHLYMAPGMFHCVGGVGPSVFDKLTPLMNWVENGVAPTRIIASQIEGGKVFRTRPLCPYPQVAGYLGSGSIDEASSFSCR